MSFRKGFKVWVEVADGSWAAAEVAEDGGKIVRALTESGKLVLLSIVVQLWSFFNFFGFARLVGLKMLCL